MTSSNHPLFKGFLDDPQAQVQIPTAFFSQLLPLIKDLATLKLLLYMFWHSEMQPSKISQFRMVDFISDPGLLHMLGNDDNLQHALELLIKLQAVLEVNIEWMDEKYYFLNTPQGQAAVKAIQNGEWKETHVQRQAIHMAEKAPNIFELYEQNIGVITPMMVDILKDDETTYPAEWIKEAIQIAVTRNVRTWNYVQAILKRWQKEGYRDEENRRNDPQDPESYRKSWLKR